MSLGQNSISVHIMLFIGGVLVRERTEGWGGAEFTFTCEYCVLFETHPCAQQSDGVISMAGSLLRSIILFTA